MTVAQAPVTLRPASDDDEPFLRRLYASARAEEFAALGLAPPALDDLLAMQYEAQDRGYRSQYPGATCEVVIVDGEPAGRLYVDRAPDAVHVVDIALLPEYRGHGIGTHLLRGLLREGVATGRPVTLSAARTNPALALYERLGLRVVDGDDVYVQLRCPATVR